jgi:hypothetical protein
MNVWTSTPQKAADVTYATQARLYAEQALNGANRCAEAWSAAAFASYRERHDLCKTTCPTWPFWTGL